MNHKKLLFLAILSTSVMAGNEGALLQTGSDILTPASKGCDEIDNALDEALYRANQTDNANAGDLGTAEDADANACLPSLENIGIMINGAVPSFSLDGLLTAVRDKACKAMQIAFEKGLENLVVKGKTPYQLAELDISIGSTGSGVNVKKSGRSVFYPVEQEAVKMGGELGKKAVDAIFDEVPSTQGVNRTIKKRSDQIGSDYKDAVDSARGGINDL